LLADSGSIFVQISDENLHRVRTLLDEVFGSPNFMALIAFKKTGFASTNELASTCDYILWYVRDRENAFVRQVFTERNLEDKDFQFYDTVQYPSGERRSPTGEEQESWKDLPDGAELLARNPMVSPGYLESLSQPITFNGAAYPCPPNRHWATTPNGISRLVLADRIAVKGNTLRFVRFLKDFAVRPVTTIWIDLSSGGFVGDLRRYVVQTDMRVIQRCLLMSTRPGDLVLDPTCGSGTTAQVAEQWGRRWITIDTSRVAVAIARQRLLTAKFEMYALVDEAKGLSEGLKCKTLPHVTLKSIAQNSNLDPIFAKHGPVLDERLASCNKALAGVTDAVRSKLQAKLGAKIAEEGKKSITDADTRRWSFPEKGGKWEHWEVPFDTDPDWPKALQDAVTAYRAAWRAKMDEVNACIAANADQEELVDQPEIVRGVTRVSGPFTVEAVQPPEMSLGDVIAEIPGFDGEPEEMESFEAEEASAPRIVRRVEARADLEAQNLDAYLDKMTRLLRTDGVRFPNNKQMKFSRLDPLVGDASGLHAEGRWTPDGQADEDAEGRATLCVAFGPQYGPVTAKLVEELVRAASRRGYDDLVIAGFSFDGPAQATIEEAQHPKLRIHMAHVRPDVNPGMDGLLKEQPGSQLFTVFGQPRVSVDGPDAEGMYTVTMEGVDIYNPVTNEIASTGASKVAAWFLDGDYDGRTFCITQAFFPDKTAWDKLAKALKDVLDPEAFEAFTGTTSLPFAPGPNKCVAVKVIDPRGNEVMKVQRLG
jgi:adenine-specific DNA-methyltransferase